MYMPLCVLKQMQALASWTEMKIKQCSNFAQTSVTVPGQVWKLKKQKACQGDAGPS